MRLVTGDPVFESGLLHVRLVVDKVTQGQVCGGQSNTRTDLWWTK